jgi:hypothetical protein
MLMALNRFKTLLGARVVVIGISACLASALSAEPLQLDAAQMDSVTAGTGVERPTGFVAVDADARGARTTTWVRSNARLDAFGMPGLPSGAGTVYISTYGVAYARAAGEGASTSATADGINAQPGLTLGREGRHWVHHGSRSTIAIYHAKTASTPILDRRSLYFP